MAVYRSYAEQFAWEEAYEAGRLEGLLEGLEAVLRLQFGEAGLALLPQVRRHATTQLVERLLNAVQPTTTLKAFGALIDIGVSDSGGGSASPSCST